MKNKLIILCGIPCSSKTTWAKEYLANNPNCIRVNRDDLRMMLKDKGFVDKPLENMISSIQTMILVEAFINNLDVIIDATNCKLKYLNNWIDVAESLVLEEDIEVDLKVKLFEIDKGEAYSRNSKRYQEGKQPLVPINVIDNMYNNLQELKKNFDFDKYKLD